MVFKAEGHSFLAEILNDEGGLHARGSQSQQNKRYLKQELRTLVFLRFLAYVAHLHRQIQAMSLIDVCISK